MATNSRIYQGQPGTLETTLYTVPTGGKLHKFQVTVTNVTTADATISLSIVPSGGTAGVTNRILQSVPVKANSVANLTFNQVLNEGDFLSALQGTASALTIVISGVTE